MDKMNLFRQHIEENLKQYEHTVSEAFKSKYAILQVSERRYVVIERSSVTTEALGVPYFFNYRIVSPKLRWDAAVLELAKQRKVEP